MYYIFVGCFRCSTEVYSRHKGRASHPTNAPADCKPSMGMDLEDSAPVGEENGVIRFVTLILCNKFDVYCLLALVT